MRNLNFRRVFAFTGLFSLAVIYTVLWAHMIADPLSRSGSDFSGFYTYGRILQTRGIAYIHDVQEQKRVQEQIVGYEVNPILYTHVPLTALLSAAVVDEDYVGSFKRWAVVLILLNGLNTVLLMRTLDANRFTREQLIMLGMGTFLFFPTFSGFMNGREDGIVLLGVILWISGVFRRKYFWAGLGLSLTSIRPQIALMLAVPFLFRHRNVFWGFALGGLLHAGLTLAVVRLDGLLKFVESVRYIESTVWFEPHSFDMPTISGLLRRNFEILDPAPLEALVWSCYGLGMAAFCLVWHRSREIGERQIGLLCLAAVFLQPYAHYHDLILLLIPIFCLVRILEKEKPVDPYYPAMAPLVVSLLSGLGFAGSGGLKFPIVYLVMTLLAWGLIASDRFPKAAA